MMFRVISLTLALLTIWPSEFALAKDVKSTALTSLEVRPVQRSTTDIFEVLSRLIRADKNYEANNYTQSYADYLAVTQFDPQNIKALLGLGNTALELEKYNVAFKVFKYLETLPLSAREHQAYTIGLTLTQAQSGVLKNPETSLKKALELAPSDPRIWNALADSYEIQARWIDSWQAYKKAHDSGLSDSEFHNNLGQSLMRQKKYKAAVSHFAYASKYAPAIIKYDNNRRFALLMSGDYLEALSNLDDMQASEIITEAGILATQRQELTLAKSLLEKALEISPRYNQRAANTLQTLNDVNLVEL